MKVDVEVEEAATAEISLCDSCGREADDHHLVPKEEVEEHLGKIERKIRGQLIEIGITDVPGPTYHTRYRKSESSVTEIPALSLTATISTTRMVSTSPGGVSGNVTEKHYDGIDADERELIETAESLEDERKQLASVLTQAIKALSQLSNLRSMKDELDLCRVCYEVKFGFGGEND